MAMDDRVIHLVRREVDRVLAEAAAGPEDLHTELHALATKVDRLEQRLTELESSQRAAEPVRRGPRTRKAVEADPA